MDTDRDPRRGQVPLPGFAESAPAQGRVPLPGSSETVPADPAAQTRTEGIRRVRRMSNWTAAALIVGTGATTLALAHHAFPVAAPAASSASTDRGRHHGGHERDERTDGVSLRRDDQRVGRGRDNHHPHRERQGRRHPRPARRCLPRQLMVTSMPGLTVAAPWRRVGTGDATVAVAERAALGTSARVAVWPPENLGGALAAVDRVLSVLDRQASRFRQDSEISWIHRSEGGLFMLSDGLAEAISVALEAARWTGGLADPTVGGALISLGYDRDFAAIDPERCEPAGSLVPVPGWQTVRLEGPVLHLPAGVRLDLGATAKGLGSDRAVRAAMAANSQAGGVLVSLGGDMAVAGQSPRDGWPILVADEPDPAGDREPSQSGSPVGRSRPRRSPAANGGGQAACCTTLWIPGPGFPRTGHGRRSALPRRRVPTPTPQPQPRSSPATRQSNGWRRPVCQRGSCPMTGKCATQAAGRTPTVTASRSHRAATCMAEQDQEVCGKRHLMPDCPATSSRPAVPPSRPGARVPTPGHCQMGVCRVPPSP